jgi:hypothetical protein
MYNVKYIRGMFNDGAGFGPITVGKSFGPNFIQNVLW